MKRLPLLITLLALLVLSASVAYWVLQLYKPDQRPLAAAPAPALPEPAVDAAASLFGGEAIAVMAANYQLTGVVAAGREGVAILVADGQPPKALQVGKEIAAGVVVKEVHARYVMLSEGGVLKRIELATDAKPAADMAAPTAMPSEQQQMQMQMEQQQQQQQQQPQEPPPEMPPPGQPVPEPAPPPPAPPVQMPAPTRTIGGSPPVSQ